MPNDLSRQRETAYLYYKIIIMPDEARLMHKYLTKPKKGPN